MELLEELVEEVLLRLPPSEPASLVRAVLVYKPWCRLISGRRFRRRYREFHRSPPMLGFLYNLINDCDDCECGFVPVCSFRPPHADHCGQVLDARHGFVLIDEGYGENNSALLVIWDPTTDEWWDLPSPPLVSRDCALFHWNATVLCAATASGACDHLDCHGGPFIVVTVGTLTSEVMFLCFYSSQAGVWSEPTLVPKDPNCSVDQCPAALVGNILCFSTEEGGRVLLFDLSTQKICSINLPIPYESHTTVLMTMEDGGLGVAKLDGAARLSLWSIEENPNRAVETGLRWTQIRVIELEKVLPAVSALSICSGFLSFACGIGVFFVGTHDGLFTFDLKSGRVSKLSEQACGDDGYFSGVPYMSFYTPALGAAAASTGEGPSTGASSASKA